MRIACLMHAASLAVTLAMLVDVHLATADPPKTAYDSARNELVISGDAGKRSFRLAIRFDVLPAQKPPLTRPSGDPIGCDCSWNNHGNALEYIRELRVTSGAVKRTVSKRLTDRVVSLHVKELVAALSSDGSAVFVCSYLGDGAGASLAMWSLSLTGGYDWLWATDLEADQDAPEYTTSDSCREIAEAAGKQREQLIVSSRVRSMLRP